ncbi:hypothetical protein LJC60_09875 [Ruminococcaceae bacterium OttesenSCG-928-D13]|nr:hypothetical protein [Ruminococcaceae bacterium OttesenSCG-928-D13]
MAKASKKITLVDRVQARKAQRQLCQLCEWKNRVAGKANCLFPQCVRTAPRRWPQYRDK